MLIVICSILLAIVIAGIVLCVKGTRNNSDGMAIGGVFSIIFSCIFLCFACYFLFSYIADISTSHTIDSKILMYEEENAEIENKINEVVANYLKHENDTLTNLNPENAMTILTVYPELKSDKLVASQIENYISNNEKIKELKSSKINIAVKKWWVYFGG